VQCKHWRSRQVGVTVVRELKGVIAARKAAGGFVVTGGTFTREAWHFAQQSGVELIDGEKLESLIREIERKRAEDTVGKAPAPSVELQTPHARAESVPCPTCGSAMVKRVARQGTRAGQEFLGCSRFPECRGTRAIT
jgi:restriction system protein